MIYTISNEYLELSVDSFGAEMKRLCGTNGIDYLCPEKRRNWERTSPILFPNTGWVKDNSLFYKGRSYPYRQHGFAKDSEFSILYHDSTQISFCLSWSKESLLYCPFYFKLTVSYVLEGHSVAIKTSVTNESQDFTMYYSLGFHPGFSCPLRDDECAEDYEISFDKPVTASRLVLKNAMVAGKLEKYWNMVKTVPVREGMFDQGSYSMVDISSHAVSLISKNGNYVRLEFNSYPNLVLWAPPFKQITNICIEPWFGQPDRISGEPDISKKPYTKKLLPLEMDEMFFRIMVG